MIQYCGNQMSTLISYAKNIYNKNDSKAGH